MLSIMAEHHEQQPPSNEQKKDEGSYLLRERRYERLQRNISLPQGIDEQNVNAKLENGCLTVTLNKTERAKARKIPLA
jgi:HSP20 family protein